MPTAAIIIPCYNREDLVLETIESCCKQTISDIEIIAVDDGSKDNTVKVLRELAEQDDRIKVVCSVNQGLSGARNVGFTYSSAPWLLFLDSDDLLHPRAIEYLLAATHHHQVNLVIGGEIGFYSSNLTDVWKTALHEDKQEFSEEVRYESVKGFLDTSSSSFNNILIHRQVFLNAGGFDSQLRGCEDSELLYRISVLCQQEAVVKFMTPLVTLKRLSDDTLSSQLRKSDSPWNARSCRTVCKNILRHIPQARLSDYQPEFDRLYMVACYAFRNGLYAEAIDCWLTWKQTRLCCPNLVPSYHRILHQSFGWLGAELILSIARRLLGRD